MAMRHPVPAMDEKGFIHDPVGRVCLIRDCGDEVVGVADGRERGVEYLLVSVSESEVVSLWRPAKAHATHGGEGPVK